MAIQYSFGFEIRPTLRLDHVERLISERKIMTPVPRRSTLIAWIEGGIIEGCKVGSFWVVYQDSFDRWVESFAAKPVAA